MDVESDGEAKKKRHLCLNLKGLGFEKSSEDRTPESCEEMQPLPCVATSTEPPGCAYGRSK